MDKQNVVFTTPRKISAEAHEGAEVHVKNTYEVFFIE